MSKAIKLQGNNFWDSSSVVYQKQPLNNVLSNNYDIIANNVGTFPIDIDKYRYLMFFLSYDGIFQTGTDCLAPILIPTSVVKTGVTFLTQHIEGVGSYNDEYSANFTWTSNGNITIDGTIVNNRKPVLLGIK